MTRYEPADSLETPRFSDVRDLENADAAKVAHDLLGPIALRKKNRDG